MKILSIQTPRDRLPKAAPAVSTETFTPRLSIGTEGLLDLFKKKSIAKEIAEDPARISVNSKNASQMMQTVRHYLDTPEAYLPCGEKVTVTTNIFGEDLRNISVDKLLSELDKFVSNWKKDAEALLKFARKEAPFRKKITYDAHQAFLSAVRGGQTGMVGEEIMQKHVLPHLSKFFPTASDAMASGSLPNIGCHGPLYKFVPIDAKLHKYMSIEDGTHSSHNEKIPVPIPSLSERDLQRLFKILDKFAGKPKAGNNLDSYDDYCGMVMGESDVNDVFFLEKGIMLSSEEDTSEMVPVVWNSGIDSGYTVLDQYLNHVYSVIYAWCQIGLLSLRRNLSAAVENYEEIKEDPAVLTEAVVGKYGEFTPATEGFLGDLAKSIRFSNETAGAFNPFGRQTVDGKGVTPSINISINLGVGAAAVPKKELPTAKEFRAQLRKTIDEKVAETYGDTGWANRNISIFSGELEHPNMGFLYDGRWAVRIDKVASEYDKVYSSILKESSKQLDIEELRSKLTRDIARVYSVERDQDRRIRKVEDAWRMNRHKLETYSWDGIGLSFRTGIGFTESMFRKSDNGKYVLTPHNPATTDEEYSYYVPNRNNYTKYVDAIHSLLNLADRIDDELASRLKDNGDLPSDLAERVRRDFQEGSFVFTKYSEFGKHLFADGKSANSLYLSVFGRTVKQAIGALYMLLFNSEIIEPANEGFVDVVKGAMAKIKNAVAGDKKGTKYKLEDDKYGNLKIGKNQQGKALKSLLAEALADTYQKKDWVSEHISRVPVKTEHQEFSALYIDGKPVAIDQVAGEYEKLYNLVKDAARKELPFVSKRRKLFEEAVKAAESSDDPSGAVHSIFYDNKAFLMAPYTTRVDKKFKSGGIIGFNGPMIDTKGGDSWIAWGNADKLQYPAPSQTDFQKYIDALNALIALQDKIDADKSIEEVGRMCPHLDDVPEGDEVDGNDFDYFISDQNMVEFNDVRHALSYHTQRAQLAIYHLLFTASSLNAGNEGLVDFIKDLFDGDKRNVKKILNGKKDVVVEVKQLFDKNYNNPSWMAKVPQTGSVHAPGKYDVLSYQGKPLTEGDKIIAHVNEAVRYVETGCRRLSKDMDLRTKLIQQFDRRDEDTRLKDAVDAQHGEIVKISERFKSTFKPIDIIGSDQWFKPVDGDAVVSIAGVAKTGKPIPSISVAAAPYIRKNAIETVTALVDAIGKLQQMSEDFRVGFSDNMQADDEGVYFSAVDELDGKRMTLVTAVLFDEDADDAVGNVGSPAAAARALSKHFGKVLRAYVSWLFDRGAKADSHEQNIENFKESVKARLGSDGSEK